MPLFALQSSVLYNIEPLSSLCHSRPLVPLVIMIVVVPVTLFVPAPLVFIPPPVSVFPTPFPGLVELVPLVIRLPAVVTVLFDRTIQLVVRMSQFSLAIVACVRPRRSREKRACCEHHCPTSKSHQAAFPSIGKHRFIRLLKLA